jgi:hypothetical protein
MEAGPIQAASPAIQPGLFVCSVCIATILAVAGLFSAMQAGAGFPNCEICRQSPDAFGDVPNFLGDASRRVVR